VGIHVKRPQPSGAGPHLKGMNARKAPDGLRVAAHNESIAPVTILDAQGRVVRVVPAAEFRGPQPEAAFRRPQALSRGRWRERRPTKPPRQD